MPHLTCQHPHPSPPGFSPVYRPGLSQSLFLRAKCLSAFKLPARATSSDKLSFLLAFNFSFFFFWLSGFHTETQMQIPQSLSVSLSQAAALGSPTRLETIDSGRLKESVPPVCSDRSLWTWGLKE